MPESQRKTTSTFFVPQDSSTTLAILRTKPQQWPPESPIDAATRECLQTRHFPPLRSPLALDLLSCRVLCFGLDDPLGAGEANESGRAHEDRFADGLGQNEAGPILKALGTGTGTGTGTLADGLGFSPKQVQHVVQPDTSDQDPRRRAPCPPHQEEGYRAEMRRLRR